MTTSDDDFEIEEREDPLSVTREQLTNGDIVVKAFLPFNIARSQVDGRPIRAIAANEFDDLEAEMRGETDNVRITTGYTATTTVTATRASDGSVDVVAEAELRYTPTSGLGDPTSLLADNVVVDLVAELRGKLSDELKSV